MAQQAQGMVARKKASLIGERTNAEFAAELHRLAVERDEASARERALAEVLHIINSSPGDLAPVFDALLDKAMTLCEATFGALYTYDGEAFTGLTYRGHSPELAQSLRAHPTRPYPGGPPARLVDGEIAVQISDLRETEGYRSGVYSARQLVDMGGARTVLVVALRKDKALLGYLGFFRQEVRLFTDQQIALLQNFAAQAVIAMENARLLGELRERTGDLQESLEYQTATSDVLKVISRSAFDLEPILETVVTTAARLCLAEKAILYRLENGAYRFAAGFSNEPEYERLERATPIYPGEGSVAGRAALHKRAVQIVDPLADPLYEAKEEARIGNARSMIGVPLLRDGSPIGVIALARERVEPFTTRQIELVRTFADQAVIAIENARLISETREALEQQTATAEVLQVINSSPGDLAPVVDAMLERATRLCEAHTGHLFRFENGAFFRLASRGVPEQFDKLFPPDLPVPLIPHSLPARMIETRSVVHVRDQREDDSYRLGASDVVAAVEAGILTVLFVPLIKDGEVVGHFTMHRMEVKPFSDQQIALLQNFAAQAVIAMENARLLTETREALEQQTATAEVLGVINSSPGDLKPVFDAILDKAHALCGAERGTLFLYDGGKMKAVVAHGYPEDVVEHLRAGVDLAPRHTPLFAGNHVHIADLRQDGNPTGRIVSGRGGVRTNLLVPLFRNGALLGMISCNRTEVRPFSDKEIALIENFAAQAVIAIENARLITETREALEKQTATAEILSVISSSPTDVQPTFEAIAARAALLCDAVHAAVFRFDGSLIHMGAMYGVTEAEREASERTFPLPPGRTSATTRALENREVVHIPDVKTDPEYTPSLHVFGTALSVPMLHDGVPMGAITVTRPHVERFSDAQIELLKTFADQAVIAIQNVRLFNELNERTRDLEESLEYQTATSDVLQVISRSTFDLHPVLDTLLQTAARLCNSDSGGVTVKDGDVFRYAAIYGVSDELTDVLRQRPLVPGRDTVAGRTVLEGRVVHLADVTTDPSYGWGEVAASNEIRSVIGVPLLRGTEVTGTFSLARNHVERFTERQIELVRTFADQAVIAIENTRLLNEIRERTDDLQESLEYQTATSDVLKVISRSTFDLQPVLDTLIQTAAQLCKADGGAITIREDEAFRFVAVDGVSGEFSTAMRGRLLTEERGRPLQDKILQGRTTHIADILDDPEYRQNKSATLGKLRTILIVPMLRDGTAIGALHFHRLHVDPFSERQIELARTFADQAVIAIENTRLLEELRELLEQQQAIAEILQVINRSPGELQPVFDAILEKAMALCDVAYGDLELYDGKSFRAVATRGLTDTFDAQVRRGYPADDNPATRPLIAGERVNHVANMADLDFSKVFAHEPVKHEGHHTLLCVPLRRDDALLGMIACARGEVRAFSEKEIALLENFAAQAVIAMDNARLLDEIRHRQAELRVTFDNMGDGVAMFDADLKLAAWNRNFQQILDLPDEFVAPRPTLEEYIRYLAEHGEYGSVDIEAEVRRLLGLVATKWTAERTRPDGRVIELRNDPVPGGGFVLMYRDITERKRAEAEIRAARDAAEAALRELKTAQASLIQAEKMASLGQLTAGIAHEIKNPLNFVNNFASLSNELLSELKDVAAPALEALDDEKRGELDETMTMLSGNLEKIAEHGRRADNIVKSMLEHSRGVSGERRAVDLNALVEESLNLAYHGARAQDQAFNITLERDFDRTLKPIELVPQEMTRVFLNLFGNGFYAANKRAHANGDAAFRPVLRVATRDEGDAVEVRVRDNGTGIPLDIRDKLFQPFFTTKPTGEGTGLGLSISYDIVTQQHGGTIAVESEVGAYTEFTVRLPRAGAERTAGRQA